MRVAFCCISAHNGPLPCNQRCHIPARGSLSGHAHSLACHRGDRRNHSHTGSGAIMQILRTFDSSSMEIDATVYAMGLLPNPSRQLVHDMLEMAKFKQSKPIFYGASNAVKR